MKVEVSTPEEYMGDVIGDLSSKRAQILGTDKRGHLTIINAYVPLAELPGYSQAAVYVCRPGHLLYGAVTYERGTEEYCREHHC